ncbi:hypothetical protein PGIGA_G00145160 [Pangasianodon gigas]|uniref:Uncharacterized protein n=1 Tax=Pangasianodon gigas TaxID=30993 RepID=A0ACC5XM11_PANGG|nr:hypothetical protein [Pangasianodon gigas]
MSFRRAVKLACGLAGGSAVVVACAYVADKHREVVRFEPGFSAVLHAAQPPAYSSHSWDYNWDKREPSSVTNAKRKGSVGDENGSEVENNKPTATRHLFLIRHSQYNLNGSGDKEKRLTALGTAPHARLGGTASQHHYHEDGARIEAAFRRYIHRADPKQKDDSYEIIVCHANVIRFFVCRALQFPPEGWLRLGLNNGSITWLTIRPSGRVALRALGDSGFMPPDKVTRT